MTRPAPPHEPDPDAEREVDLGRYLDALVARWWLPAAGLVIGVVLGYLLAVGGKEVYRAQATVYVGTPYGPNGTRCRASRRTRTPSAGSPAGRRRSSRSLRKPACPPGAPRRGLDAPDQERRREDGAQPALRRHGQGRQARRGERGDGRDRRAHRRRGRRLREAEDEDLQEQIASRQTAARRRSTHSQRRPSPSSSGASSTERLTLGTLLLTAGAAARHARAGPAPGPAAARAGGAGRAAARHRPRRRRRRRPPEARATRSAVGGLIGLILGILAALLWEPIAARAGRATT